MIRPFVSFAAAWCLLMPSLHAQVFTPAPASTAAFVHPGIFSSQTELETIRRRLASHRSDDPMTAGWQSVMTSRFADVEYQPAPVAIVTRKDKSPTPVNERDSAMVAYVLALRWALTGEEEPRARSVAIMDAWADVFQDHQGDESTYLDSAWVVTVWSAAGEIMRHAKYQGRASGWPPAKIDKFSTMIRALEAQSSHIITRPFNPGSNWGMSAMLGDMAAGVFLDDRAMYDQGRNAVLKYMPNVIKKEGWCNEIYRDAWHGGVALTAAIEAGEIGRHQGDLSVYHAKYDGQADPRIVVALRWYANPLRGIPAGPLPAMPNKAAGWMYDAKNTTRNTGAFEMALNFYTRIEHVTGLDDFKDMTLHFYRPSGQDNSIYITSDSLTHADLN